MLDSFKLNSLKLNIFCVVTCTLIILVVVFSPRAGSNFSLPFSAFSLQAGSRSSSSSQQTCSFLHPANASNVAHIPVLDELGVFDPSSDSMRAFDSRIRDFFGANNCSVQVFMTWIAPVSAFGDRAFVSLETLFQTNRNSCLIIVSRSMDSEEGQKILNPLISKGFRVLAVRPDLCTLFKNIPAEDWLNRIHNGSMSPGKIAFGQQLSDLMRLTLVYRYGGIYIDTDFVILKDISGLRNSVGVQIAEANGKWRELNNAVLIFDKGHPLLFKFIEEFSVHYNGNDWGQNGPYMLSRVVRWLEKTGGVGNFTILPLPAFYPFDWQNYRDFFARPYDDGRAKWVDAKVHELQESSYGLHLWNSQTKGSKIEEGSAVGRLISDHCIICSKNIFM